MKNDKCRMKSAKVPLPDVFQTENTDIGDLYTVIRERLARSDLLGRRGMDLQDANLRSQLAALSINPALERIAGPAGHPHVTLPVPGEPRRMVQVWIQATPSGLRPIVEGRKDGELREVDRSQRVSGESDERGRILPATGTVGEDRLAPGPEQGLTDIEPARDLRDRELLVGDHLHGRELVLGRARRSGTRHR